MLQKLRGQKPPALLVLELFKVKVEYIIKVFSWTLKIPYFGLCTKLFFENAPKKEFKFNN